MRVLTRLVDGLRYEVVVFDTAPTGHTLRLLSFPLQLAKTVERFDELKNTVFPLMKQVCACLIDGTTIRV